MKLLKTILFTGFISFAFGQAPLIQWQQTLGGSDFDFANSIQQTSDGGYIVAGSSSSSDGDVTGGNGFIDSDYWIVKLDASGSLDWQKTLGGSGNDFAESIQQTSDGGYIVAGYSSSVDGDIISNKGFYDYWIVKLDALGNIDWQKTLGGSEDDYANSIQQTSDGGYIVAGSSKSIDGDITGNNGDYDYWIVKLDALGNIVWQKTLGGSGTEMVRSIQQTSDGGYIVAGFTKSSDGDVTGNNGDEDCWIVKLDALGNIDWQKTLGGSNTDDAYSIQQTTDGGYIVAGYSKSSDGDVSGNKGGEDYWIVKLDALGNIDWQKTLGGSNTDNPSSIQQTSDGGYIICGVSDSNDGDVIGNNGDEDYWIVKLDALGNLDWQKTLGGSNTDAASSIQQTSDGGYIIAGASNSSDGDLIGNNGSLDYWIVKLDSDASASLRKDELIKIEVAPNPTKDKVTLSVGSELEGKEFIITNASGQIVLNGTFKETEQKLDLSNFENGVYFIITDENSKPVKVIKQ